MMRGSCAYHTPHTHTHTQRERDRDNCLHSEPFYGCLDFFRNNPGEPIPENTLTKSHLSRSLIIPYLLPLSITIYGTLCSIYMPVFLHNLSPSFLWHTSWLGTLQFILHIFLHPTIVFFLADRTIGRAYGTVCRLSSVVCLSVCRL